MGHADMIDTIAFEVFELLRISSVAVFLVWAAQSSFCCCFIVSVLTVHTVLHEIISNEKYTNMRKKRH